ncbi:MAG: type II toxin-antitoxin system VapC family toxin [Tepidiformaceae bacterium]
MTLVVDASAVVAALVDAGPAGFWVRNRLRAEELAAPSLMPFEVANVVRRHLAAGIISATSASDSLGELATLPVQVAAFAPLARRAWELRENLTIFDASYVALAEMLGATLITLDRRLASAPGLRCTVEYFAR